MKKLTSLFLVLCLVSCNQEPNPEEVIDISEALRSFGEALSTVVEESSEYGQLRYHANLENGDNTKTEHEFSSEILESLKMPALDLVTVYGFEQFEFVEMFGQSGVMADNDQAVMVALMIYYAEYQNSLVPYITDSNIINSKSAWYSDPIDINRLAYCIFEAVGAELIFEAWKGRAMTRYAIRKAIVKALGKIGARIGLGVLGTAFVVGDVLWCMTRQE